MEKYNKYAVMNGPSKPFQNYKMLTRTDIEMALNENSGLTDKHRAQILDRVYREAIEALKETDKALQDTTMFRPAYSVTHIEQRNKEIIDKYPSETPRD